VPVDVSLEVSSGSELVSHEIAELRQQLQSMKRQTVIVMEQSRKSSDRERTSLQQAQEALELKETATADAARSAQHENYMLALMTDASHDMAGMLLLFYCFLAIFSTPFFVLQIFILLFIGAFVDATAEEHRVNARVETLLRLAKTHGINFLAGEDRTCRIVQFQDRATQTRGFLDFWNSTLAMVYNAMFLRNPQPDNLLEIMGKFRDVHSIHGFVKAQMIASAKLALIWLKICHSKLDFNTAVETFYLKASKKKIKVDKHDAAKSPIAKVMVDELLWVDTGFFKEFRYDVSTQSGPTCKRKRKHRQLDIVLFCFFF
jgi:hypothetical protein